jgi:hypothetical protein
MQGVKMASFIECMQTAFGDLVIGLAIYAALSFVVIVILLAIIFKMINKNKTNEVKQVG